MTQKEAFQLMRTGKNIFLTGPAGSGKTHLLNQYINFLNERGVNVAVTASTGIAATHIKGITIHSWSGIGIKDSLTDWDLDALEQKQYLYKRYEKTKVLIIDEISMLKASVLDSIDKIARMFKRTDSPFGGMQVIFCGDFFQLPPISRKNPQEEIYLDEKDLRTPFAFNSKVWNECDLNVCYLNTQFRQNDDNLLHILNSIRNNSVSKEIHSTLKEKVAEIEDDEITKLFTHNNNVDSYNQKKLEAIKQPQKNYKMKSKGKANLVDSLKRGCPVPENLILKKDALVMFVKNNPTAGYVNGTVGKIIDFEDNFPIVETRNKERFIAMPQSWSIEENNKILAEVEQIPLKPAWAVTIHKSQGMTLEKAYIDLSNSFVEGQGYVALSRIKKLDGLFLKGFNEKALSVHPEVKEVDKNFKNISIKIFEEIQNKKDDQLEKEENDFLEFIGAKKFKISDTEGNKLSTYQITKNLIKEGRNIDEISSQRGLTEGTIINHITKLIEEKSLKKQEISYLKPHDSNFKKMLSEIEEVLEEKEDTKLTPIFQSLNGKYSYNEIRFALLFI